MSRVTGTRGLSIIKNYEGCRLSAYKCPAGVWTIGYGHTGSVDNRRITAGMVITHSKAETLLRNDLASFESTVNACVTVPITQNMFDALVSFAFNVGGGALRTSSLLKKLNARDYTGAANEFVRWNKANGKVLAGLTKRRNSEKTLFLDGVEVLSERLVDYKTNTTLNYRSEPRIHTSTYKGTLPKGTLVKVVYGSGKPDKNGLVWVRVKMNGNYYYISKKYLVAI